MHHTFKEEVRAKPFTINRFRAQHASSRCRARILYRRALYVKKQITSMLLSNTTCSHIIPARHVALSIQDPDARQLQSCKDANEQIRRDIVRPHSQFVLLDKD